MTKQASGVVDPEVMDSLRALDKPGEPSFLGEMIQIFYEDSPPRLAAMSDAVARRDAAEISEVAHAMKGSCGNFGANDLETLCCDMELIGRAGELERAADKLSEIVAEYARVKTALGRYL